MSTFDRRTFLRLAGLGAVGTSALLASCGSGGGGGGTASGGQTTIRYAWWGNNIRQQNYTKALELFQEENPDVSIDTEFAEYAAFQERMTTQMAARNVPDIFWIAAPQVMTYQKNNLYRSLEDIESLDLSDYSEEDLEGFRIDGELNTMPHGIFVPVVRFNQSFLDEEGLQLPEGGEWTWDSLAQFLIDYNDNNGGERRGVSYDADHDLTFESWVRQLGQQLWTEGGDVGFDVDALASWFDWWEKLRKAGAALSLSEQEGIGAAWADVGDRVLARFGSSNHIIDDAQMFPDWTFTLRSTPEFPDAAAGHKFLYTPRLAVYQGIDDDKVEAAGSVVNFNTNSVEFIKIVGMTMGAPPNPRVLEAAYEFASDDETEMLAVVEADRGAERRPRYEAPAGSSTWRSIMARASEEVALERRSVVAAAESMIADIQAAIDQER